ncbi:MAG: NAD(P)/FAD-dependent oxidoreductase [Desulfarculus sp.]|nr:NAD(P)/FAD-dependent oxidoreductase [Desulfarculus sp.]
MSGFDYDVFIIGGGGSGGFTAATTALKSGARVAMAEAGRLGGLCILAGCMPSKTLLHHAALIRERGADGRAAYPGVLGHKRQVVEFLAGNRVQAVQAKIAQGLEVIPGRAAFVDPHTLEVNGRRVTAEKIVIATGSREVMPALEGLAAASPLVAESFMELEALPASLLVLGGGAIALELAQFAARMGVAVSLVQRSGQLLSNEDQSVGQVMKEALEDDGVKVFTDTQLQAVRPAGGGWRLSFLHHDQPFELEAEAVLAALGRRPNLEGLNLAAAGVAVKGGAVAVDQFMRTSQPHIFAAGDVTGGPMVVNLAVVQGEVAGHNATHPEARALDDRVLPRAVYTDPQFARVGLNHGQAHHAGLRFAEATQVLSEMGVARTYPQPLRGFMTMRADRDTGLIVGAELVAPNAAEMIHDVAVAMTLGGRPRDIAAIPYLHPSLAEATNFCADRLARELKQ